MRPAFISSCATGGQNCVVRYRAWDFVCKRLLIIDLPDSLSCPFLLSSLCRSSPACYLSISIICLPEFTHRFLVYIFNLFVKFTLDIILSQIAEARQSKWAAKRKNWVGLSVREIYHLEQTRPQICHSLTFNVFFMEQ